MSVLVLPDPKTWSPFGNCEATKVETIARHPVRCRHQIPCNLNFCVGPNDDESDGLLSLENG